MSEERARIREYRSGDEAGILQVFREVFQGERSALAWKWQFADTVGGPGWVAVLDTGSEVVGQHSLIRKDLNLRGRRVTAAHECDAMIKKSHRGLGQYVKLAEQNYAAAEKAGCKVLLGFASRRSYPGSIPLLIRTLDWEFVGNLQYYYRRIGHRRWLGPLDGPTRSARAGLASLRLAARCRRLGGDITFQSSDRMTTEFGEGLRQIKDYDTAAVFKDAPYLRWRYENHPEHKYRFHTITLGTSVEGLAVTRDCGDVVAICELLHRRKDVAQAALLLEYVVAACVRGRGQVIESYGLDNGFFEAVFRRAGFFVQEYSQITFGIRLLGEEPRIANAVRPVGNWSLSYGDTDAI